MMAKEEIKRVPTGIKGFDKLIEGGFIEGSSVLIGGAPGTGKTIFCLEFIYWGAVKYGEIGLYVTVEERENDLRKQAKRLGMDFEKLEKEKKVFFLKIPVDVAQVDIITEIKKKITEINAKRIVIDSISIISINATMYKLDIKPQPSSLVSFENLEVTPHITLHERIKQFIYIFISRIKDLNKTVLFIGDSPSSIESTTFLTRDTVSEFVCDGVIMLYYAGIGGLGDRSLRIMKMRSTNQIRDIVPLDIIDNRGIHVLSESIKK